MRLYKIKLLIFILVFLLLTFFLISCKKTELTEGSQESVNTSQETLKEFKLPVEVPEKPVIVFCSNRTGDYEFYYMSTDGKM